MSLCLQHWRFENEKWKTMIYRLFFLQEILGRNMTNHVVIATDNDIFVVPGLFFKHLALGNLQTIDDFLNQFVMFCS